MAISTRRERRKISGNGNRSRTLSLVREQSKINGSGNGHTKYERLSDEEIVTLAQGGDERAQDWLIKSYEYLVHFKARAYFLQGADHDDTLQEGMIGLYKAIRDYRPGKSSLSDGAPCSFRFFAILCITRQIITAVKTATRKKHTPMQSYASLNANVFDEDASSTLIDVIPTPAEDPLDLIIADEEIGHILSVLIEILSDLEWNVLQLYTEGKTYAEIAVALNKHTKVIDNALYRVKLKIKELRN